MSPRSRATAVREHGSAGPSAARRHEADLRLAALACARDDQALTTLEEELLAPTAVRLSRRFGWAVADEAMQRLRERLFLASGPSSLRGYAGAGPLATWVRIAAGRMAVAVAKERGATRPLEEVSESDLQLDRVSPEIALLKARYAAPLGRALAAAVARLPRRERVALRMNALDGLSVDRIAAVFHVHRSSAARWLAEARERLLADTLAALRSELQLETTEAHSLLRLVRSQLPVSLPGLLRGK